MQHTNTKSKNAKLKKTINLVEELFDDLKIQANMSAELIDSGIKTEMTQIITKALKNPLKANHAILEFYESISNNLLDLYFRKFIETRKDDVVCAYKSNTTNDLLHYTIVLKQYTQQTTQNFTQFLWDYEKTKYNRMFTLVFQLVPPELQNIAEKDFAKKTKFEKIL